MGKQSQYTENKASLQYMPLGTEYSEIWIYYAGVGAQNTSLYADFPYKENHLFI